MLVQQTGLVPFDSFDYVSVVFWVLQLVALFGITLLLLKWHTQIFPCSKTFYKTICVFVLVLPHLTHDFSCTELPGLLLKLLLICVSNRYSVLCCEELFNKEGWRGVCAHWLCGGSAEKIWQWLVVHQVCQSSNPFPSVSLHCLSKYLKGTNSNVKINSPFLPILSSDSMERQVTSPACTCSHTTTYMQAFSACRESCIAPV